MSTELVSVFTGPVAEYVNLLSSSSPMIDFTDSPVPASIGTGGTSPLAGPGYYLTQTVPELGYYEIQFMMANTFWNCNFSFGNSACGIQIRQGIAHMVDKSLFAAQDPNIPPGDGVPIDNPVPTTSIRNLLSANSCGWDSSFAETNTAGAPCTVGGGSSGTSVGGASYHLATATGVAGLCSWCQAPGSWDLDAAAAHFVAAGLATGCDGGTGPSSCATSTGPVSPDSILTGFPSSLPGTVPNFFIRVDDLARLDLGNSLAEQICYLFTGSYTIPCAYMSTTRVSSTQFPGFNTCRSTICNAPTWWLYTAAYNHATFYDDSLYQTYNSRFVSASCAAPNTAACTTQQIGGGSCSNSSVQSNAASDYMYICSPTYDTDSNRLQSQAVGVNVYSPCLSAAGDPVPGATSNAPAGPNNGVCSNGTLSSHSAGIQAEDYFGQNVFTLPMFELRDQFGYLQCDPNQAPCTSSNTWSRAINDAGVGLPNYFTWLNAYNPRPATCGPNCVPANTIRQGFAQTIHSVNPYIASTPQDLYIVNNVYDSLFKQNPLSPSQFIYWMPTGATLRSTVSYNAGLGLPAGTCNDSSGCTYDFILRTDLIWQDGSPVTAYDVAFSYLSMVETGAYLGDPASTISGITILGPGQLDISLSSNNPFILDTLTSIPILPGYWWSNAGGSSWASNVRACSGNTHCADVQYTLSGSTVICNGACINFPAANMQVNPSLIVANYDPIASHTFVGSGPWECGTVTSTGSGTCTPTGSGIGQNSYTLSAYTGFFRSSTRAAEWIWSGESDQNGPALAAVASVGSCFNAAVNLAFRCGHWQQGIGNPGSGTPVSVSTVSVVDSFYLVNWVAPYEWALMSSRIGDFAFAPTSPTVGTSVTFNQVTSGGPYTYVWNFGDGSPTTSGGGPVTHTYGATGNYGADVIMYNSQGQQVGGVQHFLTVSPGPPITTLSTDFVSWPPAPTTGQSVSFGAAVNDGTSSCPTCTYSWDFGDGSTGATGPTISHVFSNIGTYSITLTVASGSNTATATHSLAVTINAPPYGIAAFPPVFYALAPFDGSTTLTPSFPPGSCTTPNTYYDC